MTVSLKQTEAVAQYAVGETLSFLAGPTRIPVTAEVIGHEGQFILTKDSVNRIRKVRPGAIKN